MSTTLTRSTSVQSEKLGHTTFHVGDLVWRSAAGGYGVILGFTPGNQDRYGYIDVLTGGTTKSIHWTNLEKLDDQAPQS